MAKIKCPNCGNEFDLGDYGEIVSGEKIPVTIGDPKGTGDYGEEGKK